MKLIGKIVFTKKGKLAVAQDQNHQPSPQPLVGCEDKNEKVKALANKYERLLYKRLLLWATKFPNKVTVDELYNVALFGLWQGYCYDNNATLSMLSRFVRFELNKYINSIGIFRKKVSYEALDSCEIPTVKVNPTQNLEESETSALAGSILSKFDFDILMARFSGATNRELALAYGKTRNQINLRKCRAIKTLRKVIKCTD